MVDDLIDQGASVDLQGLLDGTTALHLACGNGHAEVVGLLLERGASADVRCDRRTCRIAMAERHFKWRNGMAMTMWPVCFAGSSVARQCMHAQLGLTTSFAAVPRAHGVHTPAIPRLYHNLISLCGNSCTCRHVHDLFCFKPLSSSVDTFDGRRKTRT